MYTLIKYDELDQELINQYRAAIVEAFPLIVRSSSTALDLWPKLEKHFPKHQVFVINKHQKIVGLINSIPFYWNKPLSNLPEEGWDWMLKRGISNVEAGIRANSIGGLQIIILKEFQGLGISRLMLESLKQMRVEFNYEHMVIPIRPTWKHKFPEMKMEGLTTY